MRSGEIWRDLAPVIRGSMPLRFGLSRGLECSRASLLAGSGQEDDMPPVGAAAPAETAARVVALEVEEERRRSAWLGRGRA